MKKNVIKFLLIISIFSLCSVNIKIYGQELNKKSRVLITDTLMFEDFNYTVGQLPLGWTLLGVQAPWIVNNSQSAGGTAPELALGYSFAYGLSHLTSPLFDVNGNEQLRIKYKQYLINYEMDFGEIIGLDVAFDGDTNWQVVWERPLGTVNVPQGEFEYYFNIPSGVAQMQIAFRYEGNSYALNWWLIDDITVETVADNDLLCASISGNGVPIKGLESTYIVEVINAGKTTQSDFTVKLMKEGNVELASIDGIEIDFAEKQNYTFTWIPQEENIGNSYIYAYIDFENDEILANNKTTNFVVNVQPGNIAATEIGDSLVPLRFLPFHLFNKYSLTQTLYLSEDIGIDSKPITGIVYNNQFDENVEDLHVQMFMAEVEQDELTDEWVEPSVFTLVFDGMVDFSKGPNQTLIILDSAFDYHGGNLIIYSSKSHSIQYFGPVFYGSYDSLSYRSRALEGDDEVLDPMNPPTYGYSNGYYPNIKILYSTGNAAIKDIENSKSFTLLYPDPADDVLNIKSNDLIFEVKISNILGQQVFNERISAKHHVLSTANLEQGIYLVQLSTSKGTQIQKIQIVR